MTSKNKFRRFVKTQSTLYPRVWCDSCKHDGVEFCTVADSHLVGVCEVCGERGSNAHTHAWSINTDALTARLREEFDMSFCQTGPVSAEGQWRYLTGELTLDGATVFCVGQATTTAIAEYGPTTLFTRAIKDGAARHGLRPPVDLDEGDRPLQQLVGAGLSARAPQKPAAPDRQHFAEAALKACERNSLTASQIKQWATDQFGSTAGLGSVKSSMLMTLTKRVHGNSWSNPDLDDVADLIFENRPPSDEEE